MGSESRKSHMSIPAPNSAFGTVPYDQSFLAAAVPTFVQIFTGNFLIAQLKTELAYFAEPLTAQTAR